MTANTPIHAFTDDALGDLDATGVAARIESGEVTAREVMEHRSPAPRQCRGN